MDHLVNLTAFVRVVENGGFTAAARHLNLSTTMVSNHVQELDDRLGARLLNRTTRKVSLTEIGRQYYERSLHILAELDEADRAAGALNATPRGRLRVHCHPTLARFIAPVVTAYLRDNPDVSVDLRRGDQMIDLLEEEFDLAIRLNVPPDSSLMVRRLANWALHSVLLSLISRDPSRAGEPGRSFGPQLHSLHLQPVRRRVALHQPGRRAAHGARRGKPRYVRHGAATPRCYRRPWVGAHSAFQHP
jgi:DNA-binding transcriptional LysR family regulator